MISHAFLWELESLADFLILPAPLPYLLCFLNILYLLSIALWRWGTQETTSISTIISFENLVHFVTMIVPTYTFYKYGCVRSIVFYVEIALCTLQLLIAFSMWRNMIRGKMFRYVNMHEKCVIITGANTGIGRETARYIAMMGANVILACRNMKKGQAAVDYILNTTDALEDDVKCMELDVSSLSSTLDFVHNLKKNGIKKVDVLINNAGVMMKDHVMTKEGFETTMVTNHFGHFALSLLLLPFLDKAATEDSNESCPRIVTVSSSLHKLPKHLSFHDFTFQNNNYSLFPVYGQSKLANILFAKELQRRLDSVHSPILSTVLHPGNVQSDVTRNMPAILRIGHQIFAPLLLLFQKLPRHGAYTTVHVATSPTITKKNGGGEYFVHCQATNDISTLAQDEIAAKGLWDISEKLIARHLPNASCTWEKIREELYVKTVDC